MDGLVIKRGILQHVDTELEKVIIPKHVRKVSSVAFIFHSKAVEILVEEGNECFTSIDGVLYTKDMKTLVKYPPRKSDKKFSIPEGVETIAECAFEHALYLTKVTMPDSVTKIKGLYTFSNMKNLQSVRFSENLTTISPSMFSGCQKLKNVVLPESVKKIESFAFSGCKSITKINLPQGVKYVGFNAFAGTSLETATLPKRVNYVDPQAFFHSKIESIEVEKGNRSFKAEDGVLYYCKDGKSLVTYPACKKGTEYSVLEDCNEICQVYSNSLEKLFIPASVEKIWDDAFHQSSMLSEFVVDENNEHYTAVSGVLFTKDMKTLVAYPVNKLDEEYVIPDGVERVENGAFLYSNNLLVLEMPESVKTIGKYAIFDCSVTEMNLAGEIEKDSICSFGLEKLTIMSNVKEIKGFDGCNELEYVRIPETVKKICDYAFGSCEKLKTVIVELKDTELDKHAFGRSDKVTIYAPKGSKAEAFAKEKGFKFKKLVSMSKKKNLNNCCKTLWNVIIKDVEPLTFRGYLRQIVPIIMENGVVVFTASDDKTVEMFNGKYNRHVKELLKDTTGEEWAVECVLNDTYYSVLEDAKSITVEDGVLVDVDYSAEIVKIGADVHKIKSMSVFAFNENLRCIQVDKDNEYFASKDGVLFTKDMETLLVYPSAKIDEEYIVPDSVVSIKSYAFYGKENLKSVTMPDSVEKVGDYAFYGCYNLEQIKLSENLEYISDFMLNDCRALKSVEIPDSVKEIKRYAFRDCKKLTSVKIPEEVFCIEEYAFANCEKLKSVFLNVATIEKNAFRGSRNVTLYSENEYVEKYAEKNKIKFKNLDVDKFLAENEE